MISTLIFDWDGTLHNTAKLYGCAFRNAYSFLVKEGYAPERYYSDEETSAYLGMNMVNMWNTFMPELPQEVKRQAAGIIAGYMDNAVKSGKARLFNGAEQLLDTLKNNGYNLVVLSNCRHSYMEAHKAAFNLDKWFDDYYCCEDFNFAPKEEIFPSISKKYPGNFVMIGDRNSDIKVAYVHCILFIGCAYGYGDDRELEGADFIANNVSEIKMIIDKLKKTVDYYNII